MTIYRFTGPSTTRKHRGVCPGCGKKVTRSKTFEHTVSPFNCVGEGDERRPKTWQEVAADVQAEADAWAPKFRCQNCAFTDWVATLSVDDLAREIRIEGYERESHQRAGRDRRAVLCAERIAAYEVRVQELTTPAVTP